MLWLEVGVRSSAPVKRRFVSRDPTATGQVGSVNGPEEPEAMEGIGYQLLAEGERKAGCRILKTGDVPWLRADDWRGEPMVTLRGLEVRIVAIWAKEQGKGTFKRLIENIERSGLTPVVVCPFHSMERILIKWGWQPTRFADADEWRPSRRNGLMTEPTPQHTEPQREPITLSEINERYQLDCNSGMNDDDS